MPRYSLPASAVTVTAPPIAPNDLAITIDDLKSNVGFPSSDTEFDAMFRSMIVEATDYVEEISGTLLRPMTVLEEFDCFPCGSVALGLKHNPVRLVHYCQYFNPDGEWAYVSLNDFNSWLTHNPPILVRTSGTWPLTKPQYSPAVRVSYDAGPETVAQARPGLVNAVKLLATFYYQNMDGRQKGGPVPIPPSVESMILAHSRRGYA